MKKVLNWVRNFVIGILILLIVLSIVAKFNRSEYILNYAPMKVLSGSMEPKIKVGDLVIAKKIDPSKIKEGDVITYKIKDTTYVTHRVIEVLNNNNSILFKTKGDANNVEDKDLVFGESLVGKLVLRIPKFGYFIDFVTKPLGFIVLFLVPTIILIGKEAISYIK